MSRNSETKSSPHRCEGKEWVILRLTHQGETVNEDVLQDYLIDNFGAETEVFFPFRRSGAYSYSEKVSVLEGYIFVKLGAHVTSAAFARCPYLHLLNDKLYYVENSYVEGLQDQLQEVFEEEFFPSDPVIILEGPYSNLKGSIIEVYKDVVIVDIVLRSTTIRKDFKKYQVRRYC